MAEGRIDLEGLAERAEAAVNDVREAAEDVVRKGLEALVAVGTSAQEALDELNAEEIVTEGGTAEPMP